MAETRPLIAYAGRFVLPLLLLVAAGTTWYLAGQRGGVERAVVPAGEQPGLATPLVSVRRVGDLAAQRSQSESLAAVLESLPNEPGGLSCALVLVDGEPVIDIRSSRGLVPSYAQLLITGHAAIDVLGPEFRYETRLMAQSLPDDNGRIARGAYLIGSGDPVLMSYGYSIGFRPILSTRTPIEDLAAAVVDAGVLRIDGGIIAVDRRYDDQRSLPGWPEEFLTRGIVGPLTALQLDDGFAERAAANLGVAVPADQPAVLAAQRFAELLGTVEVQVFGDNRGVFPEEEVPTLVPVASVVSPPLRDIVFQMLAVNDATAAEMLMKELGSLDGEAGTTQAGGRVIQGLLQDQGVDVPVPFRDGSGLDPIGGTSCDQLARAADAIPDGHPTLDVLPGYDLPGVFDGLFVGVELVADLRLVGGVEGDASGLVARTVESDGSGPRVTIASIVNRSGGPSLGDLWYQEALVEMVDDLRAASTVVDLDLDG